MPLMMHGTERLTVTPADQTATNGAHQQINITINSDNPESFRRWLLKGGDVEIGNALARAAKTKNTLLDPKISRR
jgi:hypothetical protein